MSKIKSQKILAIDPGTRNLGVAFFEGEELIYYGVKVIPYQTSQKETLIEGRKIISRLIQDFKPTTLVVEKTFFLNNKKSKLLNMFVREIQTVGMRKGLKVFAFATNTVRKNICGNGAASKNDIAHVIVSRYPELKAYLTSNRRWKEKFYKNMFDAIALGLVILTKRILNFHGVLCK